MFARHDLVWLSARGWLRAREAVPTHCHAAIDRWRRQGWPAVVRRADAGQPDDRVAVGIALPPAANGGKLRIACSVALDDIESHAPPLGLARVAPTVPRSWRGALAALEEQAAQRRLPMRVYGSVALQALTGQQYLTATSDLDVLVHPVSPAQLRSALDLLRSFSGMLPLDGEIVFPDGRAVAWKELASVLGAPSPARVLAKEMGGVSLVTTSALFAPREKEGTVPAGDRPLILNDRRLHPNIGGRSPVGTVPFPGHA